MVSTVVMVSTVMRRRFIMATAWLATRGFCVTCSLITSLGLHLEDQSPVHSVDLTFVEHAIVLLEAPVVSNTPSSIVNAVEVVFPLMPERL